MSLLRNMNHSIRQQVWVWRVWWLIVDWFDLPNLSTFTTGDHSFYETTSLSLSSLMIDDWFIWSYSTNCIYYRRRIILQYNKLEFIKYIDEWLIDWFDLPNLNTFTTGYDSFINTQNINLISFILLLFSIRCPFQ